MALLRRFKIYLAKVIKETALVMCSKLLLPSNGTTLRNLLYVENSE